MRIHWMIGFAWYDFWIGAYYDREAQILYICPLPMIVISLWLQNDKLIHDMSLHSEWYDAIHKTSLEEWRKRINDGASIIYR